MMRDSFTEMCLEKKHIPHFGYNNFSVLFKKVSVYVKIKHVKTVDEFKVGHKLTSSKKSKYKNRLGKSNKISTHGPNGNCSVTTYLQAN